MRIHVTATDPLRTGRHSDLVTHAVVANHGASGVSSMAKVIARKRRIVAAGVADAVMDGVVPVVVVNGVYSVPAAVVRLERVMCPANARIGTGYNNSLPGKSQRPHLRRVCVIDARFDCFRALKIRRRLNGRTWPRQVIMDMRIAFHSCHIRPGSQRFGDLATTFDQNCIDNVEGTMLQPAFAQPLQDWSLRRLTFS